MSTPSRIIFSAGLMLAAVCRLAAVSLDELVKDSPFSPAPTGADAAPVPTQNATVEFRGIITTKADVLFGLYDRTKQAGAWVGKEQPGADFVVHAYDPASDTVSFDYQGQKFNLPLSSSKVTAAAPSAVVAVAPQPGTATVVVAAVPGADQRRLESIAAEVRRRRALRQGAAGGLAPAPVVAK